MAKQITKEEARKPDIFIETTDKIHRFLEDHIQIFFAIAAISVLSTVFYLGWQKFSLSKEMSSQEKYYLLEKQTTQVEKKITTPKTLAEDYGDLPKKLEEFRIKNKGTTASAMAALSLADIYSKYSEYAQAQKEVEASLADMSSHSNAFFTGLLKAKLSSILINEKDFEKARKYLSEIVATPEQNFLHADSLLKIGMTYQIEKKIDKAREAYQKVVAQYFNSDAAHSAQSYLRVLEAQ